MDDFLLSICNVQEERKIKPGTLAGYCQAITRGLKFLSAMGKETDVAQEYLRSVTTQFQKEAAANTKTWQELSWQNKWLHWEEILKVVKDQRSEYESQVRPLSRAVESQKYLVLMFYTMVPPGRAKEYRTLTIEQHSGPFQPTCKGSNVLHYGPQVAMLQVGEYKNSKTLGTQHIDVSTIDILRVHLDDYLERDRPLLLRGNTEHGYLFVVRNNKFSMRSPFIQSLLPLLHTG